MTPHFRLTSAGLTDVGLARERNEDSMVLRDESCAWVVADGMGGYENGAWASQTIVEAARTVPLSGDFDQDTAALADAIHGANAAIYGASVVNGKRMGSTVVALYVAGMRFACFWAGDSRIYLLRGGALYRLTRDHTQVQDMVDSGLMSAAEAVNHPMGHVVSRVVGVQDVLELDAISDEITHRDTFLLCSDGLTGVVSDTEIAEHLKAFPPTVACRRMLELVLERGAPDNVTLVAVACEEATVLSLSGGGVQR